MRMVRWMCGVGLEDRLPGGELGDWGDDMALVLRRSRLRWCGHVLRKDDDDWVRRCMECGVGVQDQGGAGKSWKEVVREDCQARKLNKEDAVDRCKWRTVIKEAR